MDAYFNWRILKYAAPSLTFAGPFAGRAYGRTTAIRTRDIATIPGAYRIFEKFSGWDRTHMFARTQNGSVGIKRRQSTSRVLISSGIFPGDIATNKVIELH